MAAAASTRLRTAAAGWLICLAAAGATGCGSADRPEGGIQPGAPVGGAATELQAALAETDLPAPSALKALSYVDSGIMRTGSQYRDDWPNESVYPSGLESAVLSPLYNPVTPDTGIAYAMYSFFTDEEPIDSVVNLEWLQTAEYEDCWVGLADFTVDSWRWYAVPPSNSIDFDEAACISGGSAYAAVVCVSSATWELARIYLGGNPAPQIQNITPISGIAGQEVDFTAMMNIAPEDVDTWHWDFMGGASPGTSSEPAPHATLGEAGIYNCTVRASNGFGESEKSFLLTIAAPGGSWHTEAVGLITEMNYSTSIGIGPAGAETVHIAYLDGDPDSLFHAYCADGCWVVQSVDDYHDFEMTNSSLAVDSTGRAHVAYTPKQPPLLPRPGRRLGCYCRDGRHNPRDAYHRPRALTGAGLRGSAACQHAAQNHR
jgi:hypothetical protein